METENRNEVAIYEAPSRAVSTFIGGLDAWELAQRKASALAKSEIVPKDYKGNVANCLVALEVAERVQASPLMVMQSLNIIHGRPSWSSTFIIAAINSCGRFEPLKFKMTGDAGKDDRTCIAWTRDLKTGEELEGTPISIAMAKAEGWFQKTGSKWQTMPEQMLRYRAASFFGRLYASEILLGMRSEDEEREIVEINPPAEVTESKKTVEALNAKIKTKKTQTETSKEETKTDDPGNTAEPEQHF